MAAEVPRRNVQGATGLRADGPSPVPGRVTKPWHRRRVDGPRILPAVLTPTQLLHVEERRRMVDLLEPELHDQGLQAEVLTVARVAPAEQGEVITDGLGR